MVSAKQGAGHLQSFGFIIRRHRNRTAEYLQRATVPVFDNIVQGGKTRIDEGAEILANLLASMPIRDAKVASRVFGETVKAFAERFVINFLPESEQPLGRRRFPHGLGCHYLLFLY
jgi:hypothetical protein